MYWTSLILCVASLLSWLKAWAILVSSLLQFTNHQNLSVCLWKTQGNSSFLPPQCCPLCETLSYHTHLLPAVWVPWLLYMVLAQSSVLRGLAQGASHHSISPASLSLCEAAFLSRLPPVLAAKQSDFPERACFLCFFSYQWYFFLPFPHMFFSPYSPSPWILRPDTPSSLHSMSHYHPNQKQPFPPATLYFVIYFCMPCLALSVAFH